MRNAVHLVLLAPLALIAQSAAASVTDEIVATGNRSAAIAITGPDQLGHYTLRVNIADLDAASRGGWQTMAARAAMGTALLCDTAAPQPYGGYYYREYRDCRSQSDAIAYPQMIHARDLARAGESVAYLDLRR